MYKGGKGPLVSSKDFCVQNVLLFLPQNHSTNAEPSQLRQGASRPGWAGPGRGGAEQAAWCFHRGLPCWATWFEAPLSAVNPLNPVEEPIH